MKEGQQSITTRVNKYYTHIMEYYSTIKTDKLTHHCTGETRKRNAEGKKPDRKE